MTSNVILSDRPIEQVRQETIDTLIYNYSHAVISEEAFERRLDIVIASTDHHEIVKEVADLKPSEDEQIKQHRDTTFSVKIDPTAQEDASTYTAILSTTEKTGRWIVPSYMKCYCIMGNLKLDFTNAVFTSSSVTIEIFSLMSDQTIFVPEDVNVTTSVNNILSSVKDRSASIAGKQAPNIRLLGTAIMSDTKVKHKRTAKEQFIAFANQMKKMFDIK